MESKDEGMVDERIKEAVKLWRAAYVALESKDIFACLEHAMQFHNHLVKTDLLNNSAAREDIKKQSKKFKDETYLYRTVSVTSYLSMASTSGSDILTQASIIKMLYNIFLDYSAQGKFTLNDKALTINWDKKIACDILLYGAVEKVKRQIIGQVEEGEKRDVLLTKLSICRNCDALVEFYKANLKENHDSNMPLEIQNSAHKSFIIEHANYSGALKLIDCKTCNDAVACEDEPTLHEMRLTVEKDYIARFKMFSEDEKINAVASIINNREPIGTSPDQSPIIANRFVQCVVLELLRSNGFKITTKIQQLPPNILIVIKETVDRQLENSPKPRRASVAAIAMYHISGEAQKKEIARSSHNKTRHSDRQELTSRKISQQNQ